jgi:hypothetical protein
MKNFWRIAAVFLLLVIFSVNAQGTTKSIWVCTVYRMDLYSGKDSFTTEPNPFLGEKFIVNISDASITGDSLFNTAVFDVVSSVSDGKNIEIVYQNKARSMFKMLTIQDHYPQQKTKAFSLFSRFDGYFGECE